MGLVVQSSVQDQSQMIVLKCWRGTTDFIWHSKTQTARITSQRSSLSMDWGKLKQTAMYLHQQSRGCPYDCT